MAQTKVGDKRNIQSRHIQTGGRTYSGGKIFDNEIVWYGSENLLSKEDIEDK